MAWKIMLNNPKHICWLIGGLLIVSLGACTRDGLIGKEGVYEALKGVNQGRNPSVEQSDAEDMSYREYELLRRETLGN